MELVEWHVKCYQSLGSKMGILSIQKSTALLNPAGSFPVGMSFDGRCGYFYFHCFSLHLNHEQVFFYEGRINEKWYLSLYLELNCRLLLLVYLLFYFIYI